jgi:NADPH2 dehydrogenase
MEVPAATEQFSDIIRQLKAEKIAYLHLIESRVINNIDIEKQESLDFAFDIWQNQTPILLAGGFKPDLSSAQTVDEEYKDCDVIVVFGRYFLSTPDLVYRLRHDIEANKYDRPSFYTPEQVEGYIDYPFSEQYLESTSA